MKATIDRIEGEFAVLEIGDRMVDFPLELLPPGLSEGSQLDLLFSPLSGPETSPPSEPVLSEGASILERLKAANPNQGPAVIDL